MSKTCKAFGTRLPSASTAAFDKRVRELVPTALIPAIEVLLDHIASSTESIRELDRRIAKAAEARYPEVAQLQQVKKMGGLGDILKMMPGAGQMKDLKDAEIDEKALDRTEAIIRSMTPTERHNPKTINGSRKRRIATGSGTRPQDVNAVLKQFSEAQKMMKMIPVRLAAQQAVKHDPTITISVQRTKKMTLRLQLLPMIRMTNNERKHL